MNCLYCGKRLSLLHKLAGREFCSDEHHAQYRQDQESMGLARLIEAKRQYSTGGSKGKKGKRPDRQHGDGPPDLCVRFIEEPPRILSQVKPAFPLGEPVLFPPAVSLPALEMPLESCGVSQCEVCVPAPVPSDKHALGEADGAEPLPFEFQLRLPGMEFAASRTQFAAAGCMEIPQTVASTDERRPAPASNTAEAELYGLALPEFALQPARCAVGTAPAISTLPTPETRAPSPHLAPQEFQPAAVLPAEPATGAPAHQTDYPAQIVGQLENLTVDTLFPVEVAAATGPAFHEAGDPEARKPKPGLAIPNSALPLSGALRGAHGMRLPMEPAPPAGDSRDSSASPQPLQAHVVRPGKATMSGNLTLPMAGLCQTGVPAPSAERLPLTPAAGPVTIRAFIVPPPHLKLGAPPSLPQAGWANVPAREPASGGLVSETLTLPVPMNAGDPRLGESVATEGIPANGPARIRDLAPLDIDAADLAPAAFSPADESQPAPAWRVDEIALVLEHGSLDAGGLADSAIESAPAGLEDQLLPLRLGNLGPACTPEVGRGDIQPMAPDRQPFIPRIEFEPVRDESSGGGSANDSEEKLWRRAWPQLAARWSGVPSGFKWGMLAIPLVAALVFHTLNKQTPEFAERIPEERPEFTQVSTEPAPIPANESATTAADAPETAAAVETPSAPVPPEQPGGFAERWQNLQANITDRAAISIADDFRSGLASWEGEPNWAKTWSYDKAGFVRPGSLALYAPSVSLTDYAMEFAGQVEKTGLSWVFRASDTNNYHAARLVVTNPGPIPEGVISRYSVVNGKRGKQTQTPIPFALRNGKTYRFRVEVRGSSFTIYLDDKVVDFFKDDRLPQGGVGFYRSKGERARLRWVSVVHQYDVIGRLCALIAPYNLENASRSYSR